MLPDERPAPLLPTRRGAPHRCPSPQGPLKRGEARPPCRNKLCVCGVLPSLPLPFKKLHILVLCGLLSPLGTITCSVTATLAHPREGVDGANVWTEGPTRGFSVRTALPLPLCVSLEWEEGTGDALGAPT